ncbi:MAG: hypothetical protein ACI4F9_10020 [Lachnospiraceae bacterium]
MEIKIVIQSSIPITIIHCEVACEQEEERTITRKSFWQEESPSEEDEGQYRSIFYFNPFGAVTVLAWAIDEEGNETTVVEQTVSSGKTKTEEDSEFERQETERRNAKEIEIFEENIGTLERERKIDEDNIDKQIVDSVGQENQTEDKKKPVIKIEGVKPYMNQREAVSIVVKLEDENLDFEKSTVFLKERTKKIEATYKREYVGKIEVEFYNINQDGKYEIEAIAKDKYGNEERKVLYFFLNQTGTRFKVYSDIKPYMNYIPDIKIFLQNQKNVSILSCLVNGKNIQYEYKNKQITLNSSNQDIWRDGRKNIVLTVRDCAGNINKMPPLRFVLDREKPEWKIKGVQDGGIYYSQREIEISLKDSSDQILSIQLNGREIKNEKDTVVFKVENYGKWELKLKAKDRANNYSEENVCFWIKPYNPVKSQQLSFFHISYFLSILLFVVESILVRRQNKKD